MSEYLRFGIDLGTTNSCIARTTAKGIEILQNADQMSVTPSAVRVLKSGGIIVGLRATNAIVSDPDNVATEFKRLMGQKYKKAFPLSGRSFTPEELSAEVLKALLANAKRIAGEDVTEAVITVPAAFTTLQCDATSQAAKMAGLDGYHLLQEPIAAAIAFGAKAETHGERLVVFDLGGGTLDIAVISTRDGRLTVLEHRGDNHLGGKDIDRLIVEEIFLPHLRREFSLPDVNNNEKEFTRLFRKLVTVAEYAKIELSTARETLVTILDLGEDENGQPIETEFDLSRGEVDSLSQPLYQRCINLLSEAIEGARIKNTDISRILLVGGPTQMPSLRETLGNHFKIAIDGSLDPMTVVARGAAIYASTIESNKKATGTGSETNADAIPVRLVYDAVLSSTQTIVAGKITTKNKVVKEIKFEAKNGLWSGGWQEIQDGFFETTLILQESAMNVFKIAFRDESGKEYEASPSEFSIMHGMMINAVPLPHTISIEFTAQDGTHQLSSVFPRMTLLPAEKDVTFYASQTLRPSEADTSLAIKLWEGEALTDPLANHWIGNMHIYSENITRPIPEGSEIRLHIKIDTSRLVTVEAFIPHLNRHFTEKIYMPKEGELDYLEQMEQVPQHLQIYLKRLSKLEDFLLYNSSNIAVEKSEFPQLIYDDQTGETREDSGFENWGTEPSPQDEIDELRREIEDLDIEIITAKDSTVVNHDLARRFVDRAREIRARIAELEKRYNYLSGNQKLLEFQLLAQEIEGDVNSYGTQAQQDRFKLLYSELRRTIARGDKRMAEKQVQAMRDIRRQVLHAQDWFWHDWLNYYVGTTPKFTEEVEARKWVDEGKLGQKNEDMQKVKTAVRRLWGLEIWDSAGGDGTIVPDTERTAKPGIKR